METATARLGVTGDVTEGAHPLWLQPESHNEMFCCALETYWPLTVKPPNYKIPALLMFSTICVFSKWKRLLSHHDISFIVAMASFFPPDPPDIRQEHAENRLHLPGAGSAAARLSDDSLGELHGPRC